MGNYPRYSDEEISEAISSTPNFKTCVPDGIPIEFFKALIPRKDDSEESSENNRKYFIRTQSLNQSYFEC